MKDFTVGTGGTQIGENIILNGRFIFNIGGGFTFGESDGSTAGTKTKNVSSFHGSFASNFFLMNNKLYFLNKKT
ncbi:hypothetical protein ACYTX7_10025, partial [Streptococcus pyogenes]